MSRAYPWRVPAVSGPISFSYLISVLHKVFFDLLPLLLPVGVHLQENFGYPLVPTKVCGDIYVTTAIT